MMKFLKDPKVLKVLAVIGTTGIQIAASLIAKHQQEQEIQKVVEKILKNRPKGNI